MTDTEPDPAFPFPLTPEAEAESSTPVADVEEIPAPVAADFLPGDVAQLLRTAADEPIESVVGTVTSTSGDAIILGTRTYSAADGWEFALVRRPLTLPTTLSEIVATLTTGNVVDLMGKGDLWSDTSTGETVPVDLIASFEVAS